ncbi:uncharacterized protein I206_104616 [Kwoniella pini CBS 10737]|uniref:Transcription elongation factor Eaf N-terminal domain-containing protein n=1 Tax=Kwoniella pini CBS 10737 TaxID=1296096 RepID=A0A1B9I7I7_9TREE|nr:uncharacterized protein I206_02150 [Kwoniella pini CBS 10737]OCF51436.1 hypothetical protein I206_02150 [Kwoniella pini CBS 10737]
MTSEISDGTYPIQFAPSITSQWGAKKRRRDEDDLIAFRYNFKPASITPNTPGSYNVSSGIGGSGQLVFDTNTGIQQVFDVREENSKARECVLIFNEETKSFTLHALPSTLHLTLNRSSRPKAPSVASISSSTSSRSIPLSKAQQNSKAEIVPDDEELGGEIEETPKVKRSRPSEIRQMKSGKSLPRKQPLATAPIPSFSTSNTTTTTKKATKAKTKGKTTTKKGSSVKGKKKLETIEPETPTKFKSSEFIEDSDEEIANSEANNPTEDQEFDEFANLLGQSLAQGDEDDSEEEEDEDDEDDEDLGGARLVVGGSSAALDDDGSEWI